MDKKLLAHAFLAAPSAFVFGLSLVRTLKIVDVLSITIPVATGAFLLFILFRTGWAVWRLASSETVKKNADQFLWSCIFFSMLSFMFGMAVSGLISFSADFMRISTAVWLGVLTCVGIYPFLRDAKRLADAVGPGQIPVGQRDQSKK